MARKPHIYSLLCVSITLLAGLFSHDATLFAQELFEVRHFAGSPGGLGAADGAGPAARFQFPTGLWGDGTYLYVSDQNGRAIRRVTIATGEVELLAGSLTARGSSDGVGTAARFNNVSALWGDGTYLYAADCSSAFGSVRRMTLATSEIVTIAGFSRCLTAIWGTGTALYIAEAPGPFIPRSPPPPPGALRKIDLTANAVTTIPTPADFLILGKLTGNARDLFLSAGARIVAIDLATDSIRFVSTPPTAGVPRAIGGMWIGGDGFLYFSDYSGQEIVRFNPATGESQSLFGSAATRDWVDGPGASSRLREPAEIWGDGSRLFIADRGNHVIRVGDLRTLEMATLAGTGVHIADQAEDPTTPAGASWSDGTYLYFGNILTQVWRMPLSGGPASPFVGSGWRGYRDGSGDTAEFDFIAALWGDGSFLYVIDGFGERLRKISLATREVTTLVSTPGTRTFGGSVSRSIWGDGRNIYVVGSTNIYKVDALTGTIENVAGLPNTEGFNDGIGPDARFRGLAGIWGDGVHLYIAEYQSGLIRRMSLQTYEVKTLAGQFNVRGLVDGTGSQALFNSPRNIWGDGTSLYITDAYAVRKLSLATNEVRTIAGSGALGYRDGIGPEAQFASAGSLWGVGRTLFVGDALGEPVRVRAVNAATGEVETIAGRPTIFADGEGVNARFHFPTGIWGDTNYLYVTDRQNHVLRRIDRAAGDVTTVAGIAGERGNRDGVGSKARFDTPTALCGDGTAVYVADSSNYAIRKVTIATWNVETIPGTFIAPQGLWCDRNVMYVSTGNSIQKVDLKAHTSTVLISGLTVAGALWSDGRYLYFADRTTTTPVLRKLDLSTNQVTTVRSASWPASGNVWSDGRFIYFPGEFSVQRLDLSTGDLNTVAGGDIVPGSEDGVGTAARFHRPLGVWGDGRTLFVADTENHAIRTITISLPSPPLSSVPFTIPTGGSLSRITRDADQPMQIGYARLRGDQIAAPPAAVAVYGFRGNGVLVSETGVPAVAAVRQGRLYAETGGAVRTGLALLNPNAGPVTISFYFTDAAGRNFGDGAMTLEANRHFAAFLDEQPFAGSPEARTLTFTPSEPVAAIALRGHVNERGDFLMTTLPIADPSKSTASGLVVVPHYAEGGGWTTEIALVNPSDADISGTLRFLDQSGSPIGAQSYVIAPRSAIAVRRSSSDGVIRVGSIHVLPNSANPVPVGLSIFSYSVGGVTVTQTGVPTMIPSTAFNIYGETSITVRSGFAYANVSSQPVTVNYAALSAETGAVVMSGSLTIPAGGQRALFVNELPGAETLPAYFKGVLQITASGPISAIGLRGRTNERGEFLVSTTMPDQNAGLTSEVYIPHFVKGGGYTTEFIVMSGAGSIEFRSQTGDALPLPLD